MEVITNALLLRSEAKPVHVAMVYGVTGLLVGTLFLGK